MLLGSESPIFKKVHQPRYPRTTNPFAYVVRQIAQHA